MLVRVNKYVFAMTEFLNNPLSSVSDCFFFLFSVSVIFFRYFKSLLDFLRFNRFCTLEVMYTVL